MSGLIPSHDVVVVHEGDAEILGSGPVTGRLYADSSAAAPGSDADLLVILTPGVERFEYFRLLQRIAAGEVPLESILETQDRYDNHFDDSPAWQQALAARL
jgi:hypothetical protein